jgi:hypothetical protein
VRERGEMRLRGGGDLAIGPGLLLMQLVFEHIENLFDKINQLKDKELSVEQHLSEQDMKKEDKEVIDIIENSVFLKKLKELDTDKKLV